MLRNVKCVYRYPQEDDNKADENGEGDDNENGASATSPAAGAGGESSDGLPVVKGVCVDYIHANRDGASVFGRQKWRESSR